MRQREKKVSLRDIVTFSDTHHYDFFGGVEPTIQPGGQVVGLSSHLATLGHIDKRRQEEGAGSKETTPELQNYFSVAKQFVEQLTGYDLSAVKLYGALSPDPNYSMYYSLYDQAVHSNLDTTTSELQKYDEELRTRVLTTMLVHELVHATGIGSQTYITIESPDELLYLTASGGMTLTDMRKASVKTFVENEGLVPLKVGTFFEEAAAEEAASLWREANVPNAKETADEIFDFGRHSGLPTLPSRFIDVPVGEYNNVRLTISAYTAAGIYAISNFTNIDIFQLMVESRNPDHAAVAKRKIIQAVESIQPGLYPTLRDTPYDKDAFTDSYELIIAAIDKKIAQQTKLGSAVIDMSASLV